MPDTTAIDGDQLSDALRALGVNFILGGQQIDTPLNHQPARLLAALASSSEARLRLSLIPLFFEHPGFAAHVRAVARRLDPAPRLTLQCYYTAAVWLAQKYCALSLPDHFSGQLALHPTHDPDENLRELAKRHAELSGAHLNWLGTYQHAAQVWQMGREYRETAT